MSKNFLRNEEFFRLLLARLFDAGLQKLNPVFKNLLDFDCPALALRPKMSLEDLTEPLFFWNKMIMPEQSYRSDVEKYTDFSDLGQIALKQFIVPKWCDSSSDICNLQISKTEIKKEFAADEWFNDKLKNIYLSFDDFKVRPLTKMENK